VTVENIGLSWARCASFAKLKRRCAPTEAGLRAGRFVSRDSTGALMETVLILYVIGASALLIWSTSHRSDDLSHKCTHPAPKIGIDYIPVPSSVLREWIACYPNLVVFSVFSDSERKAEKERRPGMLTVSMNDLPSLLRCFPPGSTGAFVRGDDIERFDTQIEAKLLQLGIEAIYLLDDDVNCAPSVTSEKDLSLRSARGERKPMLRTSVYEVTIGTRLGALSPRSH
jgi:hypothetical protein